MADKAELRSRTNIAVLGGLGNTCLYHAWQNLYRLSLQAFLLKVGPKANSVAFFIKCADLVSADSKKPINKPSQSLIHFST